MATTKTAGTRTRSTATASAKARTKPATVDATAVIDLDRVRKPFYAYVGVADLAVEKLRTLPEVYTHGFTTAQAQVNHARGSVKTLPDSVREQLQTLPTKARGTYADLVDRGHKLVTTVRNNPNAKAAVRQAKTARTQAKGAATSVRRSVGSVEKAVETVASKVG
jgi:hypothetical protein